MARTAPPAADRPLALHGGTGPLYDAVIDHHYLDPGASGMDPGERGRRVDQGTAGAPLTLQHSLDTVQNGLSTMPSKCSATPG